MEHAFILLMLLMLSGWILHLDATNCSVHLSSQPLTLNLLCPSAVCRLELSNMRGCNSDCPSCNIADCNKVYNLCNVSSSQSPSSTGNAAQSNEQLTTCTFVAQINSDPKGVMVTCQRRDNQLSFMSNSTICFGDLGINNHCNIGDPVNSCIKEYSFCMEPQPNVCPSLGEMVHTKTVFNQCTSTLTVQTYTVPMLTTVPVTVCPSSTTSLKLQTIETTTTVQVTTYLSSVSPTHLPTMSRASTIPFTVLYATASAIGALVVLLLVVISGWVCTCRIMKKRGKMEINIMQDSFPNRISTADDRQTFTRTQQRLDDNPLCKEHATPPQAHPNPPQQQRYDDNPLCKQHAAPPQAHPNPPQQQRYDDNPLCKQHAAPPQAHSNPPQQLRQEHLYSISLATKRKEPTHQNIQNGLNWACSGGGVSMGGANQIPRKRENNEHEYDHLVKVVKQTEGGQSKRNERISFERNQKYHTSDKQERATTLQYQTQEYLTPIKQEPKRFQNRPNMGSFQAGGASVGVGVVSQFPRQRGEIEHQYDYLVKKAKKKDSQRKRDEGIDEGEMDHDYHELEGPGDDYDYPEEKERDIVYHVLDGPTPIETDIKNFQNRPNKVYPGGGVSMGGATQFPRKQKPCDHQYDHLVKAAKKKGGQSKRDEGADAERNHGYHVLEGPPGTDVDDYDYQAEREGPEMVYHVLDGPTPVEEETQFIY